MYVLRLTEWWCSVNTTYLKSDLRTEFEVPSHRHVWQISRDSNSSPVSHVQIFLKSDAFIHEEHDQPGADWCRTADGGRQKIINK